MSGFKGTAGPYEVHIPEDGAIGRPWVSGAGYMIADVMGGGPYPVAEGRANADLFAASWDLLEALQGSLARLVSLVESGDCGFWDVETEESVIAARAAIKKALGDE